MSELIHYPSNVYFPLSDHCGQVESVSGRFDNESYQNFLSRYYSLYGSVQNQLFQSFFLYLPRIHNLLNRFVVEKSLGTHEVALDGTLLYDLRVFLEGQSNFGQARNTPENTLLLVRRFIQERIAEYDSTLKQIHDNKRIKDEKLWRRPSPRAISSRCLDSDRDEEQQQQEGNLGKYYLSKHNPHWKEYCEKIGVGVPRNRSSW